MKVKEIFLEAIKGIIITMLFAVLLCNIFVILQTKLNPDKIPSIFGYKPFIVLSGSMEPEIDVGDLVIVKEVSTNYLNIGDIIAFRDMENRVTTHRIVTIMNSNEDVCFRTKGDHNNTEDEELICSSNIEGKYFRKISGIGSVILFIQEPINFLVMMLFLFIVGMFIYLFDNKRISREEFEEFKKFKKQQVKK